MIVLGHFFVFFLTVVSEARSFSFTILWEGSPWLGVGWRVVCELILSWRNNLSL